METAQPTALSERSVIVDIVRGFALVGVLIANFTAYTEQNVPSAVLDAISSPLDKALMTFNTIFIEWKFITLFSILFGYGFGLILISLGKKDIQPIGFFTRRMLWLFVFGIIHTLFWWGDVLHLYAASGIFLLLFRKCSARAILVAAVLCIFVIAPGIEFLLRDIPEYFTDENVQGLYDQYRHGSLMEVFRTNLKVYFDAFILTGADLHDPVETLGMFLLGLFLVRIRLFESVETKQGLFRKILMLTAPLMIMYFILRWMMLREIITTEAVYFQIIMSLGILSTTCAYVCLLALSFIAYGTGFCFTALQAIGKMTLTNYLLVSAFSVLLLYGIGFGYLGSLSMHVIWVLAFVWLALEIVFSLAWQRRFRFGPLEWIWRQLTYRKWIPLRKS